MSDGAIGASLLLITGATAASGVFAAGMLRHCSSMPIWSPVVPSAVVVVGSFWLSDRGKLTPAAVLVAVLLGVIGNLGLGAGCS
jgi:hypothetical protein